MLTREKATLRGGFRPPVNQFDENQTSIRAKPIFDKHSDAGRKRQNKTIYRSSRRT